MSENGLNGHLGNWVIPAAVSVVVTAVGAAVVWGEYGERIANLRAEQIEIVRQLAEANRERAQQTVEIALLKQRMTDCEHK